MSKKKKVRVEMRRNLSKPPRENDLTRQFQEDASDDVANTERVRAKGDASRHRTIVVADQGDDDRMPSIQPHWSRGRVVRVHGLYSYVTLADGSTIRCTVRRVLKSLQTDERNIVTTGDWVWITLAPMTGGTATPEAEPLPGSASPSLEGTIERVDPRHGMLTRASRRREHVLVANVDQLVIVMSLVAPDLKPHLIDRYIASAEKGNLRPILVLNKIDLADPVALQPMVGDYTQIGIPTLFTSASTGEGIDQLRELLRDRATVFSGQSGVGKSSLLNALQPGLTLRVREVSDVNQKGKHTTTTAELIPLSFGGWVVDTPGVRQLQLWDTRAEEVEGYFAELRPFIALCRFPDCTHTHETGCRVKDAVRRKLVSERRYVSYLGLFNGVEES